MSRTFTIEAIYNTSGNRLNYDGGRFISNTPSSAAKKVFSHAARALDIGRSSLEIHIRETTKGSLHKIYKYRVRKVPNRTKIEHDGQTVVYKFVTKVKAL